MSSLQATMFLEPVEWPDPVVRIWEGKAQMWGNGARASTFASAFRYDQVHKYTRGQCDVHAMACIEEHGGKLLALMHRGHVAHVLSLHAAGDHLFTRDVIGDQAWPEDWEFSPGDFDAMSEDHLLGIDIDEIRIVDVSHWSLPCRAGPQSEIDEARLLQTVLMRIGDRCPKYEPEPDADFDPQP